MATRQQVRDAMHRQPFLGFTLRLTDGRTFSVKHPDFILVPDTDRGRELVLYEGRMHLIDLLHVVSIDQPEMAEQVTDQATEGNGS